MTEKVSELWEGLKEGAVESEYVRTRKAGSMEINVARGNDNEGNFSRRSKTETRLSRTSES